MLKLFQSEYAALFPSIETSPEQMLQTLLVKLAGHRELVG